MDWNRVSDGLPPDGEVVMTKIDDHNGCRNVQPMYLHKQRLWFVSDGSIYVYYRPTHWRPLEQGEG